MAGLGHWGRLREWSQPGLLWPGTLRGHAPWGKMMGIFWEHGSFWCDFSGILSGIQWWLVISTGFQWDQFFKFQLEWPIAELHWIHCHPWNPLIHYDSMGFHGFILHGKLPSHRTPPGWAGHQVGRAAPSSAWATPLAKPRNWSSRRRQGTRVVPGGEFWWIMGIYTYIYIYVYLYIYILYQYIYILYLYIYIYILYQYIYI